MSQRFSILDQLDIAWRGKFPPDKMALIEKHLEEFDIAALSKGVASAIRSETFPPSIALLHSKCSMYQSTKVKGKQKLRPGDEDPACPGERFLTVDEAVGELERMKIEHPKSFDPNGPRTNGGDLNSLNDPTLEDVINRIYVKGLEACVRSEGRAIEPTQNILF